ncbi:hypothetical protein [Solimonas fluminis]|uniref:hypothetical protein n=1 Tax=Solimonas fluminis TaxID=2086571 RepID=UPI0010570445|nr:hypothetical protein [Solimonas fluminis]
MLPDWRRSGFPPEDEALIDQIEAELGAARTEWSAEVWGRVVEFLLSAREGRALQAKRAALRRKRGRPKKPPGLLEPLQQDRLTPQEWLDWFDGWRELAQTPPDNSPVAKEVPKMTVADVARLIAVFSLRRHLSDGRAMEPAEIHIEKLAKKIEGEYAAMERASSTPSS